MDLNSSLNQIIAVCGNLTLDELVQGSKTTVLPGGSALFASGAAASLGAKVSILGNIGRDYPSSNITRLRNLCVDTRFLYRTSDLTTRFRITRFNGSRNLQVLAAGAPVTLPQNPGLFLGVHLGPVFNEISRLLVKTIRRKCDFLSADLQGFIRTVSRTDIVRIEQRRIGHLLRECDMVQASIEEAESQFGSTDQMRILDLLRAYGVPFSNITMGARGSWLSVEGRGVFSVPAFRDQSSRDSTGAGDIFAGSWLTTYLATSDPLWAAAVGSAFASIGSRRSGIDKFRIDKRELFRRAGNVYERVKCVSR